MTGQHGGLSGATALLALIGICATFSSAQADAVSDFYRGKQISVVIGTSAGNDYDFRGRLERGTHIAPWSDIEQATVNAVAVATGIGWPWLWIPNSGSSNAGQPTGPWLWLLQG